jgi:hypothetical protein
MAVVTIPAEVVDGSVQQFLRRHLLEHHPQRIQS